MPLSRLIALIINAHPWGIHALGARRGTDIAERPFIVRDLPAGIAVKQTPVTGMKHARRMPDKSLLHDINERFLPALQPAKRFMGCSGRIPLRLTGWQKIGGARRDRTDGLKLAKLALSQLSYGPFQKGE